MPRRRPQPPARPARTATAAVLALTVVAGCGAPPELRQPTASTTPQATSSATPGSTGLPTTPPAPTAPPGAGVPVPTPSPGLTAVACTAGPSGSRVADLVRGRTGLLPRNATVRLRTGPLCAGDWHYTVLDVTGYEQLHVVTQGPPRSPRLVTAGTDVCTAEVRVTGPPAIQTLACDGGPVPGPGA
ncbi:hypothetical protein [Micromonospora endolithica]|uniref:Uncharacterized protein n=1 Tax=Micromonospora endolithica TaxID=230091 RepID=A0A3A9ZDY6_9ACTN|nr:hypothetical protein [Micromonospora endolithica]RKN46490.1 hypothetical protein D7223_15190 [Micromonospora endolithica]